MSLEGTARPPVPWTVQGAVYGAGLFSNSMTHMVSVLVPLWVLSFETSALLVGIALGSRHILPVLFSIHGGALMDRLGIRRVMIGFAILGIAVPLIFPFFPYLWAVVILQMLSGISAAMGWIGTQAHIGAVMRGEARYAGRLTFCNRFGNLTGPIAIGAAWDFLGPWGAFSFWTLWAVGLLVASLKLPAPRAAVVAAAPEKLRAGDLLPRAADYMTTIRMMAVPAIAFVVIMTLLRHSSNGIQNSFYIVYLNEIGLSGTLIGVLLSSSSILGAAGSLAAGPMTRFLRAHWLLIIAVAASIFLIVITPLLGAFVPLLIAMAIRGGTMGIGQALLISVLASSAGEAQGKAVGLRTTANRISVMVIPVIMGAVIEVFGLANSFYIVGVVLMALMAWSTIHLYRSPDFANDRPARDQS
ncbi:MAG: MFS transporter [Alphaproteobacteria bacterium]